MQLLRHPGARGWRRTRVDGGLTGQDLYFSDLLTVNLNMFADLGQRQGLVA